MIIAAVVTNAPASADVVIPQTLGAYYVHYWNPLWAYRSASETTYSASTSNLPLIYTRWVSSTGSYYDDVYPSDARVVLMTQVAADKIEYYRDELNGSNGTICRHAPLTINRNVSAGSVQQDISYWRRLGMSEDPDICRITSIDSSSNWSWIFHDTITYGAPLRRVARDGSQYEASPMVIQREGFP